MYMYIVQYVFTRTEYDVSLTVQHTLELYYFLAKNIEYRIKKSQNVSRNYLCKILFLFAVCVSFH